MIELLIDALISGLIFILSVLAHEYLHHYFLRKYKIESQFNIARIIIRTITFRIPHISVDRKKLVRLSLNKLRKVYCFSTISDVIFVFITLIMNALIPLKVLIILLLVTIALNITIGDFRAFFKCVIKD